MSFQFEHHPNEETIELYSRGELDEPRSELLDEHILICEGCQIRLTEADRYGRAMKAGAARLRREENARRAEGIFWARFPKSTQWFAIATPVFAGVFAVVIATTTHPSRILLDPEVKVSLFAMKGDSSQTDAGTAPAHRRLNLQLDARGLDFSSPARVELVNDSGKMLESVVSTEAFSKFELHTKQDLTPGSYFVRLYAPGSKDLVREFGVQIK